MPHVHLECVFLETRQCQQPETGSTLIASNPQYLTFRFHHKPRHNPKPYPQKVLRPNSPTHQTKQQPHPKNAIQAISPRHKALFHPRQTPQSTRWSPISTNPSTTTTNPPLPTSISTPKSPHPPDPRKKTYPESSNGGDDDDDDSESEYDGVHAPSSDRVCRIFSLEWASAGQKANLCYRAMVLAAWDPSFGGLVVMMMQI